MLTLAIRMDLILKMPNGTGARLRGTAPLGPKPKPDSPNAKIRLKTQFLCSSSCDMRRLPQAKAFN
uniref:Uncharacterized protein n=1 Tax=Romanomermis culicivorax TaxID=13658 RepID=A0A915KB16_ROMCU